MRKWTEISPFTGMEEDAPTNSAGSGSVAGIGVGPMGEPGVHPKKKKKDTAQGKQHSKQPKKIAAKTKKYRV